MACVLPGHDDRVDVLAHEVTNIGDCVGSDRSGGHKKFEKSHKDGKARMRSLLRLERKGPEEKIQQRLKITNIKRSGSGGATRFKLEKE